MSDPIKPDDVRAMYLCAGALTAGRGQFPQFGALRVPRGAGFLRAEHGLSVGGKLQDLDVLEPVAAQLRRDVFCRGAETLRCPRAMRLRDDFQVALGAFAGQLLRNRGDDRLGE